MIDTMRSLYVAPLARAFKVAPWRSQTQAVAVVSIALLIIAVVGGLYLTVASRAATAGRDLQRLEARKTELVQANDELRAALSVLRSVDRLAVRALAIGFVPAKPEQIHYLRVDSYPYAAETTPLPRAATPPPPPPSTLAALSDWFAQVLQGVVLGTGQGARP
jgi:hypothetical protein